MRNRAKLLEVARKSFEAEGLSVPVDEIARRAGVGSGTIHRHFPTKESLFEAIVLGHVEQLAVDARRSAESDDPGQAFVEFCVGMVERSAGNKALAEILARVRVETKAKIAAATEDFDRALEHLVESAQSAGTVRADVGIADVRALLNSVHLAVERGHGDGPMAVRLMTVICDGLGVKQV
jgi:AcrR family transcriptional regulator